MRIVIAGGHGKIALILERLLSARGDSVAGLIRNPAQVADLEAAGAEALVVDLENASVAEVAQHVRGADAVVFAAGAGPGSGAARKETVDRDAAILLADAALEAGVSRYVMVSAMGADTRADDSASDPVFAAYLRAKAAADEAVQARAGLSATIVRPGHLTDEDAKGRVAIAESTGRGSIPRADVAAVLVAVLDAPDTGGHAFDLISGDSTIADALEAIAAVDPV
jgi:nucleoside-diphosphate-sugar epimerase